MSQVSSRIAVLIDSDNIKAEHIAGVLAELAKFGTTSIRRMYGDWTSEHLRGWKEAANQHSIHPIQQFSYTTGKNSTDSALIIDGMDLLHLNSLDAFAIVSSDSDFTRLAARFRESGAKVFGFGERKTPKAFVSACDSFTYLDVLAAAYPREKLIPAEDKDPSSTARASAVQKPPRKVGSKELRQDTRLTNLLRSGIAADADDDGWARLSNVGSTIQKQLPDFDSRNWGYEKLRDLIEAVGLFEIDRFIEQSGNSNLRVRIPKKK